MTCSRDIAYIFSLVQHIISFCHNQMYPFRITNPKAALISGQQSSNIRQLTTDSPHPSRRNTAKGELRKTVWILLKPITKTSKVIPGKNTTKGMMDGINGSLNTNNAKHKLPTKASIIPTKLPRSPRKRYSKAVICKICLFFAPKVRSNTLSLIRWYLLVLTEPISTIIPVRMLKKAMKLITQDT